MSDMCLSVMASSRAMRTFDALCQMHERGPVMELHGAVNLATSSGHDYDFGFWFGAAAS
jgi:hypothetical protein